MRDIFDDLNVVIVNDFDYVQGGATKVAIETAELLKKRGINTYFFSAVHSENVAYDFNLISTNQKEMVKDKNIVRGAINNLYNLSAKKNLKSLLDTLDPKRTIVHVHGWTKALSSSIFNVLDQKGFPYVLTAHDYFTICPNGGMFNYVTNTICNLKPMSKECMKCNCDSRNMAFKKFRIIRHYIQNNYVKFSNNLDHLITISDLSESVLTNEIKPKHIYRVYNPTSIEKKEDRISAEKNDYFIYVGRITKEKGVIELLKLLSKTGRQLKIVGDGEFKKTLEEQYKNFTNIEFLGWKQQDDVYNYMRSARALIFPSLWYEGAPLTIFEALSMGLPCFVSNKCSGAEFIENEKDGYVFNPLDDSLLKLLDCSDDVIKQFSLNSYEKYWNNPFSKERYLNDLIDVYSQILKEE